MDCCFYNHTKVERTSLCDEKETEKEKKIWYMAYLLSCCHDSRNDLCTVDYEP